VTRFMRGGPGPGPIEVMHVAESAGWAGGEAYLLRLASALDRRRFRLSVVVPESGPLAERLQGLGVTVHHVPLANRLLSPSALAGLAALLRRERPGVVQSHGARSNVYAKVAGWLAGIPVVLVTVHNSLFDYDVGTWRRRLYLWAELATNPLGDRVIAVSAAIARDLIQRYGIAAHKVVTIHNGIDADAFFPARPVSQVRHEFGLEPHHRLVGIAARMTRQKGHDLLLQALKRLVPRYPHLRCLFIGDGPLEATLSRQAAALGVESHCVFTGARADVADLLAALEVVVLPSRSEGLPFVLLEAMAVGRPVVATSVGGNPEVVQHGQTGLLTPPGDADALAVGLAFLLDHPEEATRMGAAGRSRVLTHFPLAGMVHALEALYARGRAERRPVFR